MATADSAELAVNVTGSALRIAALHSAISIGSSKVDRRAQFREILANAATIEVYLSSGVIPDDVAKP